MGLWVNIINKKKGKTIKSKEKVSYLDDKLHAQKKNRKIREKRPQRKRKVVCDIALIRSKVICNSFCVKF